MKKIESQRGLKSLMHAMATAVEKIVHRHTVKIIVLVKNRAGVPVAGRHVEITLTLGPDYAASRESRTNDQGQAEAAFVLSDSEKKFGTISTKYADGGVSVYQSEFYILPEGAGQILHTLSVP